MKTICRIATTIGTVAVCLVISEIAQAQQCEAILGYIRDTTIEEGEDSGKYQFQRFFCDNTFSSYEDAKAKGAKAHVVIDSLPNPVEAYDRSSSWSQYQRAVCEAIETQSEFYHNNRRIISVANSAVVNAWTTCVNSAGPHFWAQANHGDRKVLTLVAKFNGLQGVYQTDVAEPLSWTPQKALTCQSFIGRTRTFLGFTYGKPYLDNQEAPINCTRETVGEKVPAANVILRTGAGGLSVELLPWAPAPPPPPLPVCEVRTEEKSKTCNFANESMILDGIKMGAFQRTHIECTAPQPVTRYEAGCKTGNPALACDNAVRAVNLDGKYNNDQMVSARWWINKELPERSFWLTLFYNESKNVCVRNCGSDPAKACP